jgi:hypothetical protein
MGAAGTARKCFGGDCFAQSETFVLLYARLDRPQIDRSAPTWVLPLDLLSVGPQVKHVASHHNAEQESKASVYLL